MNQKKKDERVVLSERAVLRKKAEKAETLRNELRKARND